jgi:hypothetical protein
MDDFHKRAYYLAILASAIRKSDSLRVNVEYRSQGEDGRSTKLVLTGINGKYSPPDRCLSLYINSLLTTLPD